HSSNYSSGKLSDSGNSGNSSQQTQHDHSSNKFHAHATAAFTRSPTHQTGVVNIRKRSHTKAHRSATLLRWLSPRIAAELKISTNQCTKEHQLLLAE
ncbi:unnamed protein product, partial [Ceratitis capitata]